jgi:hypothetical protein
MTTETKSFKMIAFTRRITKTYYETAEMTYGEFSKHLRTVGLGYKKITDDETIKKMWDELANSGDDVGDGVARVDTEREQEYDDIDDENWDDDEDLWDYIETYDFDEDCFPEPEDTRTPEEKEKEAKEKAEADAKSKEFFEKRAAEMKKHAEEYAAKQKAERIANVPKNLLNVISMAAELYQHPPSPPTEEDEQWKIKVMRSVARQRILGKMKELVAELEEVAKW